MSLKREPWIVAIQNDIARQLRDCEIWPEASDWPGCLGDVVEQHYEAHLATLPPDPLPGLLREAREVIEWATRLLESPDDRLHACELLDRIDRALAEEHLS